MNKTLISVAVIAALILPVMAQKAWKIDSMKGKPLPAFEMETIDGKKITNATIKGKVTIVDFYATWCGPCKAAAPKLEAMYKQFGKDGLMIIGANSDKNQGSKEDVQKYVAEHKYSYPYTFGPKNYALAKTMGLEAFPSFALVDRNGTIVETMVGFDEAKLKAAVQKALAAK